MLTEDRLIFNQGRRYRVLPLEARHSICLEISKRRRQRVATSIFLPKELSSCVNFSKSSSRLRREKNLTIINKKSRLLKNLNVVLPTNCAISINKKTRKTKGIACFKRTKLPGQQRKRRRRKLECNGQQQLLKPPPASTTASSSSSSSSPTTSMPEACTAESPPAAPPPSPTNGTQTQPKKRRRRRLKHPESYLIQHKISQSPTSESVRSVIERMRTGFSAKPLVRSVSVVQGANQQFVEQQIQLATGQSCIISYSIELPQGEKHEPPRSSGIVEIAGEPFPQQVSIDEVQRNDVLLKQQKDEEAFMENAIKRSEKIDCERLNSDNQVVTRDNHSNNHSNNHSDKHSNNYSNNHSNHLPIQKDPIPTLCAEVSREDQTYSVEKNNSNFCSTQLSDTNDHSSETTEASRCNTPDLESLKVQHMLQNYPRWVPFDHLSFTKKEHYASQPTHSGPKSSANAANLLSQNEPHDLRISYSQHQPHEATTASSNSTGHGIPTRKHSVIMTVRKQTADGCDSHPISNAARAVSKSCQSLPTPQLHRTRSRAIQTQNSCSSDQHKVEASSIVSLEPLEKNIRLTNPATKTAYMKESKKTSLVKNPANAEPSLVAPTKAPALQQTHGKAMQKEALCHKQRLQILQALYQQLQQQSICLSQRQSSAIHYQSAPQQPSVFYQPEKKMHNQSSSINNYQSHQEKSPFPSKLEASNHNRFNQEVANHRRLVMQQQQPIVHHQPPPPPTVVHQPNKQPLIQHHYPLPNVRDHQTHQHQPQQQYALYSQPQWVRQQPNPPLLNHKQPLVVKHNYQPHPVIHHHQIPFEREVLPIPPPHKPQLGLHQQQLSVAHDHLPPPPPALHHAPGQSTFYHPYPPPPPRHDNLQKLHYYQHHQQQLQQRLESTAHHHHYLRHEALINQQPYLFRQHPPLYQPHQDSIYNHQQSDYPHLKQAYNFLQQSFLNQLASSSAHLPLTHNFNLPSR